MMKFGKIMWVISAVVMIRCGGNGKRGGEDAAEIDAAEVDAAESDDFVDTREDEEDFAPEDGDIVDAPEDDGGSDRTFVRGSMTLPFDCGVDGRGTARAGAVSVLRNTGHIELSSPLPLLGEEFGYVLYHVLAPAGDDLNVMYFYCGFSAGDSFDYIWHESYGIPLDFERAGGTCSSVGRVTDTDVEIYALEAVPGEDELVTGFSVRGPRVNIGDRGGIIKLNSRSFSVYPFEPVDCTTDCSSDPEDGWWELHMAMVDEASEDHCFGILYMLLQETGKVLLSYGFCLGSLAHLDEQVLDATWTAPSRRGDMGRVPAGPRHPVLGYILRPHPGRNGTTYLDLASAYQDCSSY